MQKHKKAEQMKKDKSLPHGGHTHNLGEIVFAGAIITGFIALIVGLLTHLL
jgi:hypothetical protein